MDGISFPSTSKIPAGPKLERRIVEKNRRNRTNALFNTLFSLIPSHHFIHSKNGRLNLPDRLEQATSYMVQLKENVDKLKKKKAEAMEAITDYNDGSDLILPIVKIRDLGLSIQITLKSRMSVHESCKVSHFLRVIEDEGAEVIGINSSVVDHKLYHTINAQRNIMIVAEERNLDERENDSCLFGDRDEDDTEHMKTCHKMTPLRYLDERSSFVIAATISNTSQSFDDLVYVATRRTHHQQQR